MSPAERANRHRLVMHRPIPSSSSSGTPSRHDPSDSAADRPAPLPSFRDVRPAPHHLLSRLQLEWDRLVRSPAILRQARTWELPVARFASLDELLRAAGLGRHECGEHGDDELLAALVSIAHHDDLAARVVLQRLLPGVSSIVRRRHSFSAQLEATDELLAAMWTVIRTYPIEQRPRYVAAGLLRAADYAAFQRFQRRQAVHIPQPTSTFDRCLSDDVAVTPAEELAELLDMARAAGMAPDDLELAERLGRGESTMQIAALRAVTDRTIRNHRAAVAYRLRAVARAAG